jgi:hypothetical protein
VGTPGTRPARHSRTELAADQRAPQTPRMTTPREDHQEEPGVGPLGSQVSDPAGDDDADGMAGPVYPPPETEPDAHENRSG